MPSYLETARQIKEGRNGRSHKDGVPTAEPWYENQAFNLIRDAPSRLDDHIVQYREYTWYDIALEAAVSALGESAHDKVNEAYANEDMAALRVAVRMYVEVGIAELKRVSAPYLSMEFASANLVSGRTARHTQEYDINNRNDQRPPSGRGHGGSVVPAPKRKEACYRRLSGGGPSGQSET
jgi:hypothetical protein